MTVQAHTSTPTYQLDGRKHGLVLRILSGALAESRHGGMSIIHDGGTDSSTPYFALVRNHHRPNMTEQSDTTMLSQYTTMAKEDLDRAIEILASSSACQ